MKSAVVGCGCQEQRTSNMAAGERVWTVAAVKCDSATGSRAISSEENNALYEQHLFIKLPLSDTNMRAPLHVQADVVQLNSLLYTNKMIQRAHKTVRK